MATNLKNVKSSALASAITSVVSPGVKITGVTYSGNTRAASPVGSETITVNGSGFNSGANVYIDTTLCATTYANATSLSFSSPAKSVASYHLFVYNTDGSVGMLPGGLTYSNLPTWVTASGSLTSVGKNLSYSQSVNATGDGTITYSVTSGSLPSGLSLNSSTGEITGTAPNVAGLSTFTITATDSQNQTASRSFSINIVSITNAIDYIVVAGGGAGGSWYNAGGGGAGGALAANSVSITGGTTYTVTIGAGGTGSNNSGVVGPVGSNSSISGTGFTTVTAIRGGGGGSSGPGGATNGGSGGGNSGYITNVAGKGVYTGSSYLSQTRQGYDGGFGGTYGGGGGGGAGAAGTNGQSTTGGNGGVGIQWNDGNYYGGGGGGSAYSDTAGNIPGNGGNGGGGRGSSYPLGAYVSNAPAYSGTTNTGGGGGGASGYHATTQQAGSGGSGVVVIRFADTYDALTSTTGSPTYTVSGGYRYYKFTASGTFTI